MSTTSEYYIQNMSQYEFERYFERLQNQERQKTRKKIQSEIDSKVKSQLKKAKKQQDKENKTLRSHIDKVSQANQEQHQCNQRMMEALKKQLNQCKATGDQQALKVQKAIDYLAQEQASLLHEMKRYQEQSQQLKSHLQQLTTDLAQEKQTRQEALRQANNYYQGLYSLYQQSRQQLDESTCQRYGLSTQVKALDHSYQQADEQYRQGIESAAVSTLSQCVRQSDEIQQLLFQRKDEESSLLTALALRQNTCVSRLSELNQEEIRAYLSEQIDQASAQLQHCQQQTQTSMYLDRWVERQESLKQSAEQLNKLDENISQLYVRYDELVEQAAHRENILKGLVQALVEVWGGEYEMDVYLDNPADLSSNLIFRTKRGPFAPNVQAVIGIDGRMEASLTGYRGVECAQDEEQLREALSRRSSVEVVRHQHQLKPDAPNPDDQGHTVVMPSELVRPQSHNTESKPNWMKKSV